VRSNQVKKVWMAVVTPGVPLDHFQCYVPKQVPVQVAGAVVLQDQFDGKKFEDVKVTKLYRFCNPVRKVFKGKVTPILNPKLDLAFYSIVTKPTGNHTLLISNQFGQQQLVVRPPRWLAVPTAKNSQIQPDTKLLSHFKCYPVTTGKPVNVVVNLTDQWHTEPKVKVGLPVIFCNPTLKIHAGKKYPIVNTAAHLVCYRLAAKPFGKSALIRNQFSTTDLAVTGADLLCVPSRKLKVSGPPPPPPPPPPQTSTLTLSCPLEGARGATLTFTGVLKPPEPSSRLSIIYKDPKGSTTTHTAEDASDGSYTDYLTPTVTGTWHAQALWAGNSQGLAADSQTCSFAVG